jgi:hypothetical protein
MLLLLVFHAFLELQRSVSGQRNNEIDVLWWTGHGYTFEF